MHKTWTCRQQINVIGCSRNVHGAFYKATLSCIQLWIHLGVLMNLGNQLSDHRFVCKVINLQVSLSFVWTFVPCFPPNFVDLGVKQRSFHVWSEHVTCLSLCDCALHMFLLFVCLCVVLPSLASQLMIAQWRKPLGCVAFLTWWVLLVLPLMAS